MLGKVFNRDRSLIYRWIKEAGFNTPEPDISEDIQEIEFDEMWHSVKKDKKFWGIKTFDRGRLSDGLSAVVTIMCSYT